MSATAIWTRFDVKVLEIELQRKRVLRLKGDPNTTMDRLLKTRIDLLDGYIRTRKLLELIT